MPVKGVQLFHHDPHIDDRGWFMELGRTKEMAERNELPTEWAQENISMSQGGVLRGLHIQRNNPQGKYISVLRGMIFDAWVDLRPDSKTFQQHGACELRVGQSIWLPPGLAHGFFTLSETALVHYKCSTLYDPESDGGIRWDSAGIEWPFDDGLDPILSKKDRALPTIGEWLERLDLKNG